ncbi:hypothetical protein PDL71_01820 [Lacibacter sp. MH-610]|uniref:HYC_CC_PP family protein n=1 Tax=Lacibacter sp. MH-610 TaxID=3020883 RepID=UPI00389191B9
MKKFIAAILAFLFLASSTGATVHMHYCMGKLADWGLTSESNSSCGKCGMEKSSENENDGCCKDEQKFVKNTADQKIAETSFEFKTAFSEAVVHSYPELPALQITSITEEYPFSHAPPRTQGVAAYILNQAFLI